jgi:hypothetical protein
MSLPATWFVLPHVGTTGNQGSHAAACAGPQGRGLFRRRQLEYRPVRTHDVRDLQRRDLSALYAPLAPRPYNIGQRGERL